MKFGGHETFFLRPGWISKGLFLASEERDVVWNSNTASDAMGVGRNMSKSIGWWLNSTGLICRPSRSGPPAPTPLGEAFLAHDPYFTDPASWWFLHLSMVLGGNPDVFSWFFRKNSDPRFTRSALEGNLIAWLDARGERKPAINTLHRDIVVLLQTYARQIPAPQVDPEDNLDCPLRHLGLLVHRRDTDTFERRHATARIPAVVVAAALGMESRGGGPEDYHDAQMDFSGPLPRVGRILGMDVETTAERIVQASDELGPEFLSLRHLAGGRFATIRTQQLAKWAEMHFSMKNAGRESPAGEVPA